MSVSSYSFAEVERKRVQATIKGTSTIIRCSGTEAGTAFIEGTVLSFDEVERGGYSVCPLNYHYCTCTRVR
jgi:hypothetical protein